MKRISIILLSLFFLQVYAEPIKPYWDRFYIPIKECVIEEIQTSKIFKPAVKIKNKQDLRNYLKALEKKGFYVLIDTKKMPSQDICFIRYVITKTGIKTEYIKPIEKLVIGAFTRKQDAVAFKKNMVKRFHFEINRKKHLKIYENSPIVENTKEGNKIDIIEVF